MSAGAGYLTPAEAEADIKANPAVVAVIEGGRPPRKTIKASPFVYRPPETIPPREMVYGRHFVRKFISGTLAPGGVGKSTMALVEAVAMASGRDLLGVKVREPIAVWYWCGEDPLDEIERRVAGILLHFKIDPSEIAGRLFIDSGRDCEIVVATESKDGAVIAEPVMQDLEATIRENNISVWILDPFVSCHEVSENDNNKIGRVMKELALLADRTNSAGDLVHHVRKNATGSETTVEDGRGAKAFSDRCRSVRTLNRMTKAEADDFGVDEEVAIRLFRVDIGKSNLFPPARAAVWRLLVSQSLGNGVDGGPDDFVGVVSTWAAPGLFDHVTTLDVQRVQQEIGKGSWREDQRAAEWAGKAVARALEWDLTDAGAKGRIKQMLKVWLRNKVLETYEGKDAKGMLRTFVRPGKPMPV